MARFIGLLVLGAVSIFGVAVLLNLNGAAHALIERQRRQPYARLFPWATSEARLRVWAGLLAVIGVIVIAVVTWAQLTGK